MIHFFSFVEYSYIAQNIYMNRFHLSRSEEKETKIFKYLVEYMKELLTFFLFSFVCLSFVKFFCSMLLVKGFFFCLVILLFNIL